MPPKIADPMAPTPLPPFEGKDVIEATVMVTNAGDGLSEAMHFAPFVLHQGESGYLLLAFDVIDVRHPFADAKHPEYGLARKHVLRAGTGLIIGPEQVEKLVQAQEEFLAESRAREERERKAERGEVPLPGLEEND